jgi:hypothetical protein
MNCARCGYLLFGVSSGRCPECGVLFSATDYSFPRGGVHFLCPHCGQGYLGVDQYGLPYPRAFRCAKCQKPIRASEMAVRPIRDGVLGESLRFGTPWDHRGRLGALRAYFLTMTAVCTRPGEFFRSTYGSDRTGALVFATLAVILSQLVWLPLAVVLDYLYPFAPALSMRQLAVQFTGWLIVLGVAWMIWLHAYAYSMCLMLWMMGAQHADFESALEVSGFATAVLAIPPVGPIWYFAVVARGLQEAYDLHPGRAWIAAAMLPLAIINLGVLWALL